MNKLFLIVFYLMLSSGCASKVALVVDKDGFGLTESDIQTIIDVVEINRKKLKETSNSYFHFKYAETLNDSTVIVDLFKNNFIPSLKENPTNYIKFKETLIFIYNPDKNLSKEKQEYLKKENLISDNGKSPFFIVDGDYLNLYITKSDNNLVIKKMKLLLQKESELKEDIKIDW